MSEIFDYKRENNFIIGSGKKGGGKSYETYFDEIMPYCYGELTGQPRKVLIFDINGEYESTKPKAEIHIKKYDPRPFKIPIIRPEDIPKFTIRREAGIFRVVMSHYNPVFDSKTGMQIKNAGSPLDEDEMIRLLNYCLENFKKGLFLIEDVSGIFGDRIPKTVAGFITRNRHLNLDIVMHVQSIAVILPRMWQNVNYVRFHKQLDGVDKSKMKLGSKYDMFQIVENIVDHKFFVEKNERFFTWVDISNSKIIGKFSRKDAERAVDEYIEQSANRRINLNKERMMQLYFNY